MSSLWQGNDYIHIVYGEKAGISVDHALVPIFVYLVGEDDDITLLEAQLPLVLGLKVIEGATTWLVHHIGLCKDEILQLLRNHLTPAYQRFQLIVGSIKCLKIT